MIGEDIFSPFRYCILFSCSLIVQRCKHYGIVIIVNEFPHISLLLYKACHIITDRMPSEEHKISHGFILPVLGGIRIESDGQGVDSG